MHACDQCGGLPDAHEIAFALRDPKHYGNLKLTGDVYHRLEGHQLRKIKMTDARLLASRFYSYQVQRPMK